VETLQWMLMNPHALLNDYPSNSRSVVNKLHKFQSLVYSKSFDVISLTETWLSDSTFDNKT